MWLRLCTLHLSEPLAGSQPRVHAPNIKILKIHNAVGRLSNMIICFFCQTGQIHPNTISMVWMSICQLNSRIILATISDLFHSLKTRTWRKGPSSKVMSISSITHYHTKHHILDIQPESSGLCCFSLTLRPGTRENSGELDKYLTARDYSCGFLHIDVVDNVGRCWKMLEDWSETREN